MIARYRQIYAMYRKLFIHELRSLNNRGQLTYHLEIEGLLTELENKTWVVHNTKPTIDTSILENYLARYINRVAISKSRVEYIKDHKQVKILYNDYANQIEGHPAPKKHKTLNPLSFIHQFMQHVLPAYFQKSRRYGLHASATKRKVLHITMIQIMVCFHLLNRRPMPLIFKITPILIIATNHKSKSTLNHPKSNSSMTFLLI